MTGATWVPVLAAFLGAAWVATPARACSIAGPQQHQIDPSMQGVDSTAPVLASAAVTDIKRGRGPQQSGCGESATTCDDLGIISLVVHASDDMTPPEHVGYRLTLQSGTPPSGLTLPMDAVEPGFADTLLLAWGDGNTDNQESFDFTVGVIAVDLAGNESAAQTVRVTDDRNTACAVARPRAPARAPALLALASLLLVVFRRRSGPRA